jgi:diketogulonate reductase-like aldo/keto reductase
MGSSGQRAAEVNALRRGFELGMTHVDTAEMYGNGLAEEAIEQAIAGVPRDSLFIVSKVLPQHATYRGTLASCEAILKRLGTDYLDVLLLHWRGRHPLDETMRAFEDLVDAGKIRALGVSNFDVADLDEARGLLTRHPIACNQVLYHLRQRHVDVALREYCARHGIAVVGYSPFGNGDFPGPDTFGGKTLAEIAARRGATPRQVALAFLVRDSPLFTIPKAVKLEHVEENAGALHLTLDPSDVAELEAAFPAAPGDSLPTV